MIGDEEFLFPPKPPVFNIWSIAFADLGCEPGSWHLCPSNIRDLGNLDCDAAQFSKSPNPSQKQNKPSISVCKMKKGERWETTLREKLISKISTFLQTIAYSQELELE